MSHLTARTPASKATGLRKVRRLLVFALGIPFLVLASILLLEKASVLPPPEVLEYQLGLSKAPVLGKFSVDLRGWGWYPIRITDRTDKAPPSITFVRFLPFQNPAIRPITFFHRDEKLSDEFFFLEKHYSWGIAKFVKPDILPKKATNVAWLPEQQFYIGAPNGDDLLEVLSILEIKKQE